MAAKRDPLQEKERLIRALVQARQAVLEAAALIPAARREQPFLGVWRLGDILAHLAGWDYANLEAAGAIQAGQLPEFYQHRDADWRTYNALLVERHGRNDWGAMLAEVEASHEALVRYLEALPAEAFGRDFGVRFKGYKVTIARLLAAEAKDEQAHGEQIRAFAGDERPAAGD